MDSEHVAMGDPSMFPQRLHYIQAIIRNRLHEEQKYYPDRGAMPLIADAWRAGVPLHTLESIAKSIDIRSWSNFRDAVMDAMDKASDG